MNAPPPGIAMTPAGVFVDSTRTTLLSDSVQIARGELRFVGATGGIGAGRVLLGTESGGYLRRVSTVRQSGDTLIVQTRPANLTDAVQSGRMSFRVPLIGNSASFSISSATNREVLVLADGVSPAASGFDFDGFIVAEPTKICDNSGTCVTLSIEITSGHLGFSPQLDGEADMSAKSFEVVASGEIEMNLDVQVTVTGSVGAEISRDFRMPIAQIRVPFVSGVISGTAQMDLYAFCGLSGSLAGSISTGMVTSGTVEIGAQYENSEWTTIFETAAHFDGKPTDWSVGLMGQLKCGIQPVIGAKLWGFVGPVFKVDPHVALVGLVQGDRWSVDLEAAVNGELAVQAEFLGFVLAEIGTSFEGPHATLAHWEGLLADPPIGQPTVCGPGQAVATFVSDNPPDNTELAVGQSFSKTWVIRNIGNCLWDNTFSLRYVSGAMSTNQSPVAVVGTVQPGATYAFNVPMKMPPTAGVYRDDWKLTSGSGQAVLVSGSSTVFAILRASTQGPSTCEPGQAVATFVSDNPLDNTEMSVGQSFTKTWVVRNSGSCVWDSRFSLRYVSGPMSTNQNPIAIVGTVAPGAAYVFNVPMRMPPAPGQYRDDWKLTDASGRTVLVDGSGTVFATLEAVDELPPDPCGPRAEPLLDINRDGALYYSGILLSVNVAAREFVVQHNILVNTDAGPCVSENTYVVHWDSNTTFFTFTDQFHFELNIPQQIDPSDMVPGRTLWVRPTSVVSRYPDPCVSPYPWCGPGDVFTAAFVWMIPE